MTHADQISSRNDGAAGCIAITFALLASATASASAAAGAAPVASANEIEMPLISVRASRVAITAQGERTYLRRRRARLPET